MFISILNLIYREFLKSAVPGISVGRTTTMTEIFAAVLAFFSVSVFLAHAYDAYRGGRWTES